MSVRRFASVMLIGLAIGGWLHADDGLLAMLHIDSIDFEVRSVPDKKAK